MDWKQQLESYEKAGEWKDAVEYIERVLPLHSSDPEIWVRLLYLFHNIVLEERPANIDHDDLAKRLLVYFNKSQKEFANNPEYLFFIGVIMHIAEYYFGQDDLSVAEEMIKKACEMNPENRLFKWQRLVDIDTKESLTEAGRLAQDILDSDSPEKHWLQTKGFPGDYVLNVQLASSAKFDHAS